MAKAKRVAVSNIGEMIHDENSGLYLLEYIFHLHQRFLCHSYARATKGIA
jgi:hypothetical protein